MTHAPKQTQTRGGYLRVTNLRRYTITAFGKPLTEDTKTKREQQTKSSAIALCRHQSNERASYLTSCRTFYDQHLVARNYFQTLCTSWTSTTNSKTHVKIFNIVCFLRSSTSLLQIDSFEWTSFQKSLRNRAVGLPQTVFLQHVLGT